MPSRYLRRFAWTLLAVACVAAAGRVVRADDPPAPPPDAAAPATPAEGTAESPAAAPAPEELNTDVPDPPDVEMKPTELGLRFTPAMARGIAKQMARGMKSQYELSDEQVDRAQDVLTRNLMKLAHDGQKQGQQSFELFMENMIANDGTFSKADGEKWAKLTRPLVGDLKKFITTSASQIGKDLTMAQRLKLTRDLAGVSAGFVMFDDRLKKWEKGELEDGSSPFFETNSRANERRNKRSSPNDPPEKREVRQARQMADNQLRWQTNVESRWTDYVEAAIDYYHFSESQAKAARTILKESLDRAKQIKTDDWEERMHRNRTAANMSNRLGKSGRQGPWMWHLDREHEEMLKPLQDLGRELRERIDELAETAQKDKAVSETREKLSKQGLEVPPA